MTRYRTVLFAGLAAVGLALAGCGGGSDDGLSASEEEQLRQDAAAEAAELRARIMALEEALGLEPGDDIGDTNEQLMARISELQMQLEEKEKAEMAAAEEAARMEAERMAAEMAATAAKLYAGIYAPAADASGTAVGNVHAAYNADGTAIVVTIGDGSAANGTNLSEDKKTSVAANHGWAGKRWAAPPGGASVEAMVYSNVEAPKMGKKFGGAAANDEFQYALTSGGITVDTSTTAVQARVALTGVTRTAGTETFKLPDPNPGGATVINVLGSHHGVSGTYNCTPSTPADGCTASVAARGFTLGAGTWTFTPSDANARVTESADTAYASYGWWIHKSADGKTFTASAFHDFNVDTLPTGEAVTALPAAGTATYMGGAAGKYALSSSTGGMNDAGHFTARATLEAEFGTTSKISGTIDQFMGADGEARNWSVELAESTITASTGVIAGDPDTGGNTDAQNTVWTIGGVKAGMTAQDAGSWSGSLRNQGADGVPQVATGAFYAEFDREGKMVGAFGANEQ